MKICLAVILGLCLFWVPVKAGTLVIGDAVPPITAKDQHEKEFCFTNTVRFLLVATERACAQAANLRLAEQGAGFLEKHSAVYLMDIHSMPAVGRFFALPKMRKYPHRIVLIQNAETLKMFPAKPGRILVMALTSEGRIREISYWDPGQEPVAGYLK